VATIREQPFYRLEKSRICCGRGGTPAVYDLSGREIIAVVEKAADAPAAELSDEANRKLRFKSARSHFDVLFYVDLDRLLRPGGGTKSEFIEQLCRLSVAR